MCRYLYESSKNKTLNWSELSLIEWESNLASKPDEATLKEAEGNIKKVSGDLKSPASIIIFASLYNLSPQLSSYPALQKFVLSVIETDFGKTGVELATVHTTSEKVDASSVAAGTAVNADAVPGSQRLRSGIFTKNLDGKKMYCDFAMV